jgi:predicted DNA-binding protein YlxM (UPF0122 family)
MKSGSTNSGRFLSVAEVASAFGCSEGAVIDLIGRNSAVAAPHFFSIAELATRWRCSRGTVYNRLRAVGAKVLDFAPSGKKGKKAIPVQVVLEIEARQMKRLC